MGKETEINYVHGEFESGKFNYLKGDYVDGLKKIKELGYEIEDYIHYFPAFCGHLTLIRYLSLYEAYKMVSGISGHFAEIGMYKGACSLLFAKLLKSYEPNSLSLVHGFDWFKGGDGLSAKEAEYIKQGAYSEDFDRVDKLIKAQRLENIVKVHNFDLSGEDIDNFFLKHPHLYFRLVFVDAGIESVLKKCLPVFWNRLVKGGVMVLDHYSFDLAPAEARITNELLPDATVRSFPGGWLPAAYIQK